MKGKKKCVLISKIKKNPWILSTVILAVFILVVVSLGAFSFDKSANKVGENFVNFINSKGSLNVSLVSSKNYGDNLYEVTVLAQGQNIPAYVTKDGKYFVQVVSPLTSTDSSPSTGDVTSSTNTNTNTNAQSIPKSNKPEVELFVMSYCPYGTQAEKGIIPALEALNDSIDFKLRFVYYAMHPDQGEVQENLNQYCIQKEQNDKLIPYLKCFLGSENSTDCLSQVGVDMNMLNSCTNVTDKEFDVMKNLDDKSSWLNGYYPLFNIDKDLNTKYGVKGSPTLVINGQQVSSARDPESFLNTICQAFNNEPSACSTQLSSNAYSAGFGYDQSSNSAGSAAQCG